MNYGTISDMKDIIVNKTCNGKCSSCGECCADILPIDGNEIRIIKDYIRKHNIKECVHLNCFQTGLDLTCPFRDNKNKICTIYPVRPAICKSFICSKPKPDIERDKALFHIKKKTESMRHIFFGGKSYYEILGILFQEMKNRYEKEKNNANK